MSGRKSKASRRAKDAKHVRLYLYMLKTPAWLSLSCQARCLLIELQALYNGTNNGELFMSVRTAATLLRTGKRHALAAFDELEERGFIRPTRKGAMAQAGQSRLATTWRLTEHDDDLNGREPSKEFVLWQKPDAPTVSKKIERARKGAAARWQKKSSVPHKDTQRTPQAYARLSESTENMLKRTPQGYAQAGFEVPSVPHKDTQLVNHPIPAQNERVLPRSAHPSAALDAQKRPWHKPSYVEGSTTSKRRSGGWYGARGNGKAWPADERLAVGLTQAELAERSGIKREYIATIERGRRNPSEAVRAKLAAALEGVPVIAT